jgi:competence protein ComEC
MAAMFDTDAPQPGRRPPRTPHYQPLVIVLAAAAAGILADRSWPLPLAAWWTLAAAGLILWLLAPILWRISPFGRRAPVTDDNTAADSDSPSPTHGASLLLGNALVLLAVAATAAAWHHCRWHLFADDDVGRYAQRKAQPICIEAVAVESPRALPPRRPDPMQVAPQSEGESLLVDLVAIRNAATWQPASGRATLLVIGEPPNIEAGDRLRCCVTLSAPAGPRNPGAFDFAAHLRADRILCRLQAESPRCISVIEPGSGWNLSRQLSRLRSRGDRVLAQYLSPRRAELASAVLLGLREELDGSRNEAFLTTGTIHILSISGLHVGVLAGVLFYVMRRTRLPRGWAVMIIAAITLLYTLMVDVEPPVVRATILVLIACAAVWLSHRPLGFNSLAAAALVVLALNPAHLFNIGAQLSFLCVAGLIWFASRWPYWGNEATTSQRQTIERLVLANETWFGWARHKGKRVVTDLALAGGLLWFLTTPLVVARFHIVSLTALALNVVLWPLMTLSLLSGFGVLLFGTVFPPLAWLCALLCDLSFWLLEAGVNAGHQTPCGHFWLPGPADWWLWGFYGVLALAVAFPHIRPRRPWCVAVLTTWLATGLAVSAWPRDRDRLDCTFLSMGHGCAVFVQFPSGRTMLYDAGQMGSPVGGVRTVSGFLWDRGIRHLDAVVLSHPDIDHYNSLPDLLERFSVGAVYVSPSMFVKENSTLRSLSRAIDDHHVPVRHVRAGDRLWSDDGGSVEVLHPPRRGVLSPGNADSLVLEIAYRGRRIVLPGDLESPGLDELLATRPRPCEALMAPHHGSRKSNSAGLASWCKPRWVVFSGDGRWSLPDIDSTYRAVGGQTLHTYNCGAIRVQVGQDGVQLTPFLTHE